MMVFVVSVYLNPFRGKLQCVSDGVNIEGGEVVAGTAYADQH